MSDILGTALSGIRVAQRQLATTSHNITNVNTEGFSRQAVDVATRIPQRFGNGFIGTGAQVTGVKRLADEFLTNQVRTTNSTYQSLSTYNSLSSRLDNLLADPQVGLTPAIQGFFGAVNGVADDPSSIPARQVMLSEAQLLADRFGYLDNRFFELEQEVNTRVRDLVTEINGLASSIAAVNQNIVLALGASGGQPPNDLLDSRDQLLEELSALVDVSTVRQDDGALNVFIGKGQALVIGNRARTVEAAQNPFEPERMEIGVRDANVTINVSNQITGGQLGGVLDFRRGTLDVARNELGRVAAGMATLINDQLELGMDLRNNLGGPLFDLNGPSVAASSRNGNPNLVPVTAEITDVGELVVSDYRLVFDGDDGAGNHLYTLTRLSDNQTFAIGPIDPADYPIEAPQIDGVTLTLTGAPSSPGDAFLVRPTLPASGSMRVMITDPARLAAASPIASQESAANFGNGRIDIVRNGSVENLPFAPGSMAFVFEADVDGLGNAGFRLTLPDGTQHELLYDPATDFNGITFNGREPTDGAIPPNPLYPFLEAWGDASFMIRGEPRVGDAFTIGNNLDAVGDNRNMLDVASLQLERTLGGGTIDFQSAYSQMVSRIGTLSNEARVNSQAQGRLLERAQEARATISGVNLDEEAANLLKFQQAYQAAAQVTSVANSLFQTLLGAIGR